MVALSCFYPYSKVDGQCRRDLVGFMEWFYSDSRVRSENLDFHNQLKDQSSLPWFCSFLGVVVAWGAGQAMSGEFRDRQNGPLYIHIVYSIHI